jgi:hypothetical protein
MEGHINFQDFCNLEFKEKGFPNLFIIILELLFTTEIKDYFLKFQLQTKPIKVKTYKQELILYKKGDILPIPHESVLKTIIYITDFFKQGYYINYFKKEYYYWGKGD